MHKRLGLAGRALRVLDIGCGNGRNSEWLRAQGHSVLSLDMCPGNNSPTKKVVLGHTKLPVKDNWAQVILMNYVLMFLNDVEREQLYMEIARVSARAYPGCLAVVEMYPAKDSHAPTKQACNDLLDEFEFSVMPRDSVGAWVHESDMRGVAWLT
jgi:SAM-dependent methyltransferase